jgi:hypothetical protein
MLLIDGHVHIYEQFDLNHFFASGFSNFAKAAETMGLKQYRPVFVLLDRHGSGWFDKLSALCGQNGTWGNLSDSFLIEKTGEEASLIVRSQNPETETAFLIAGRKIITRENLEVMALGTVRDFEDKRSLHHTVDSVRQSGAVPAVAWAAGKWLGNRGRILDALLDDPGGILYLCDNGNRPWFWKQPRHFTKARKKGIGIISGSDPLDLATEAGQAGRVGFVIHGEVTAIGFPARDMCRYLKDGSVKISCYGPLQRGFVFLRNQVRIRMTKSSFLQIGKP